MNKLEFTHHQSAHCENGVTSNLFKYNGIDVSEPMAFGIGSGIFFIYIPFLRVNQAPAVSYRPMPGIIFSRTAKRLGIEYKREKFSNPEKSFEALDRNLEKGIVTGLQVGVFYLRYLPDYYRFHFNAHNIAVYGKQGDDYLVSDPVMETTNIMTKRELERARFAKGVFAPKGHMYYPISFPKELDFPKAIKRGITQTINHMQAPVPFVGVNGIDFVANKIPYWLKHDGKKKTNHYLAQIIRMQEEIGTGGGGFRFVYAAFLQEAMDYLNKPELNEFSERMTAIGDDWREFALRASRLCKNRDKSDEGYQDISVLMHGIADKERQFYKDLKKII
ncbi:MAG: BtrH N-terminal domain-containing protein [Brumimicrobium sp.]|nr:BtrH N-terminal domain-containing protein [Brumimicrobium sp.]